MKILIYAHAFAPMVGGAETLVMTLAQGLVQQLGNKNRKCVTVVTPTPQDGFDDEMLPFRVVRRPSLWQLVHLIRKVDIIHLAGPCFLPLLLGLLFCKPTVVEHHGFQTVCPNGQLLYEPAQVPCPGHFMARRYYKCFRCNAKQGSLYSLKICFLTFLRRWLCYLVSANIALTNWLAAVLRLPRTTVIYCGVPDNTNDIDSQKFYTSLTFAFMGRLVSIKGVRILLDAVYRLKVEGLAFHLKIIGDGPERTALEARTRVLGLNNHVTFMGYLPQQILEQVLSDVAVIVMPSLAGETFGLVAAENMMCGRLVVVSDIGVLSEVVGDGGLKFPPGDVDGLAKCLRKLLKNPELVAQLSLEARRRALELFRRERMVEDHVSLYSQIL